MASTLRKRALASVLTGLVLIGGRPGRASEQPVPGVTRSDHPADCSKNRTGQRTPTAGFPRWSIDSHVRSSDDRVLNILRNGVARSPTLRDLIGVLNGSDVIVYIESRGRMRTGFSAYLVHQIVPTRSHRYLKVVVHRELARDRLTGVIAHELQHAREVAEATNVRSSADMRALFRQLDSSTCVLIRSCMETDAAVRLEAAVLDELKAGR
jgi:hypothetical protein